MDRTTLAYIDGNSNSGGTSNNNNKMTNNKHQTAKTNPKYNLLTTSHSIRCIKYESTHLIVLYCIVYIFMHIDVCTIQTLYFALFCVKYLMKEWFFCMFKFILGFVWLYNISHTRAHTYTLLSDILSHIKSFYCRQKKSNNTHTFTFETSPHIKTPSPPSPHTHTRIHTHNCHRHWCNCMFIYLCHSVWCIQKSHLVSHGNIG